jgi:GT2 family glycosyltransferase
MSGKPGEPLVGIVVVTWNGLQDTIACLTSLRQLSYHNKTVFLIDNGSRDNTVVTVKQYFPEVQVIENQTNTGYAHANNQGISRAKELGCDWILLLNNDVIMSPDSLSVMIAVGTSDEKYGIVGPVMQRTLRPDVLDMGGDLNFYIGEVRLRRYDPRFNTKRVESVDYVWGCSLLARRDIFDQCGDLDESYLAYFEDAKLCCNARKLNYETVVATHAHVRHGVGKSGEKRFLWQTNLRIRNHVLFFLQMSQPYHWFTLIPALIFWQIPFIVVQTLRLFMARTIRRKKYKNRQIVLIGAENKIAPPEEAVLQKWLIEAGYFAS